MDIDVFKRGFKLVEYIYDNQIQDLELFRIRDVGNGLAESHWKSKQWLVDELSEFLYNEDVHIAAGWLGLTGYLLRKKFPDINITSSDIDPGSCSFNILSKVGNSPTGGRLNSSSSS